jgi:hypothetical protein
MYDPSEVDAISVYTFPFMILIVQNVGFYEYVPRACLLTSNLFSDSDDCKQCSRVLAEIEHIDDEADGAGIDFVKIDDKQMAKELGVFALPAVLFFKMGSKEPVIYAGRPLHMSTFCCC